jgi:hypothetical protein
MPVSRKAEQMTNLKQAVTLVVRDSGDHRRNWNLATNANSRIVFADTFSVLQLARDHAWGERGRDVERIVIDGAAGTLYCLELLAALGGDFAGDVLFVRENLSGFLSALGRGGDRVLYALRAEDVDFYLGMKELLAAPEAPGMELLAVAN